MHQLLIVRRRKRSSVSSIVVLRLNVSAALVKHGGAMTGVNFQSDVKNHILLRIRLLDELLEY